MVRSSLGIIYKGIKFKWALGALDAAEAGAKKKQQRQDHHNLEPQIRDILIDNLVNDESIKEILMIEQEEYLCDSPFNACYQVCDYCREYKKMHTIKQPIYYKKGARRMLVSYCCDCKKHRLCRWWICLCS